LSAVARTKLVAGNWKCHKGVEQALALVIDLAGRLTVPRRVEVAVMPPFTALWAVRDACAAARIALGGQDAYWETHGAYTGEISVEMLRDVGCQYVIVGHSERRALFGDDPASVGKKARAVLAGGLAPIVCVGETLAERDAGDTTKVVDGQLAAAIEGIARDDATRVVIAYEPVWAIGTGRNAETAQAQEVHEHLRAHLRGAWGDAADQVRILYGGSVKPANAGELMAAPDIDGALVGGASLSGESFAAIAAAAES
jgi:triosephosphate isomerase (TIM)